MPKKYSLPEDEMLSLVEDLFQPYNLGAKPFLKWAGGKGQLLQKFQKLYPRELKSKKIKNYYEPFLGSGAVFFDIAQNYDIENAFLYDINEELILTYQVIQKDVSKLIEFLYRYQRFYLKLNKKQREKYFYEQRANYNLQKFNIDYEKYSDAWIPIAAQTIFLNKTCFNGLYRVNSKGEFNTPAGEYENPTICDEYNLLSVSKVLELAIIKKADFRQLRRDLKTNSFVYFDPPYRPISKTANFTSYSKHDFTDEEQIELKNLFEYIHKKGEYVMLSNSDPKNHDKKDDFFDRLYGEFKIVRIPAKRIINSNAAKRGAINEIVVTNYETDSPDYIPAPEHNIRLFIQDFEKPYWVPKLKFPIKKIKFGKSRLSFHNEVSNIDVNEIVQYFDLNLWTPITLDEEGYLLDGQHRLEAAKRMGLKYIDVVIQNTTLLSS